MTSFSLERRNILRQGAAYLRELMRKPPVG